MFKPFENLGTYKSALEIATAIGGKVKEPFFDQTNSPEPQKIKYTIEVGNHAAYAAELGDYFNRYGGSSAGYGWMNLPGTTEKNMVAPVFNLAPPDVAPVKSVATSQATAATIPFTQKHADLLNRIAKTYGFDTV